jgi:trigger factor
VQVSVDKLGPCEAKVTFSVPRADFEREYQAALRASGKNVRLKGFRPGKIPPKILEKEFGERVRQQAIEHFMSQAFDQAVQEGELQPVGHERIRIEDIDLAEQKDLEHSFSVSLKPEFELGSYKGLEVTSELEPVLDEELEEAIEELRMQQSSPAPTDESGIPEDGQAICSITWICEGETLLDREGLRMAPLAPPPGVDPELFKTAMIGAHSGQEFELEMTIPADFEPEEQRGKAATCRVAIKEAYQMLPPADEELWKLLGVESQEAFVTLARERMEQAKSFKENNRQETRLLEGLIEAHDFEVPEKLVENQTLQRKEQLRQELIQNGVPEDQHEARLAEKAAELEAVTRKSVRALFLVGAVAEREEIEVEEAEMVAELQAIARRHQAKYEDVLQHYREQGLFQQLQIELLERKVRAFLRENAKITEP